VKAGGRNMDFVEIFLQELREKGQQSIDLIKSYLESKDHTIISDLYRMFHTIKGSASLVGFNGYKTLMHKLEEYFKKYSTGEIDLSDDFWARLLLIIPPILEKSTDLSENEVQNLINIVEGKRQLTTESLQLSTQFDSQMPIELLTDFVSSTLNVENSLMRGDVKNALREIRTLKNKLSTVIEDSFYVKISDLLRNFDALVIQEAAMNNKKVRFNPDIGEERIEKKDSQMLIDVLVHLVRNAIAHGIESPEVRLQHGKPEIATITLRSYVLNNELYIELEDDGAGIDFDKVRERAKEYGLGNMKPEEVIFVPGFSTKEQADGTSGRGMGLDIIKNFATARGGDVELVTEFGKGTRFIVYFPIKTLLIHVLVVEADGYKFCVDFNDIDEVISQLDITDNKIKHKGKLFEISYQSQMAKFGIITTSQKVVLVDNILGTFDGQISNETYSFIKGFVKNVFVYPLPVINAEKISQEVVQKSEEYSILLVDDSLVTRTIVSKFLRTFGYKVFEAKEGFEAISFVEKNHPNSPDIVICDVEMPLLDGFETTKQIKKIDENMPVILFSTLSQEQLRKGMEVGADAYVSKDESPERLLRLIERLLKK